MVDTATPQRTAPIISCGPARGRRDSQALAEKR
jgi:hypothetical protein